MPQKLGINFLMQQVLSYIPHCRHLETQHPQTIILYVKTKCSVLLSICQL